MEIKFFERSEDDRLIFKQLDFQVMVHNLLETTPPKSKKELEFIISGIIDAIQTVAFEHYNDNFPCQYEWEDIYIRL
jgi:hypothetical protein